LSSTKTTTSTSASPRTTSFPLRAHASWGYFDYRMWGERFDDGNHGAHKFAVTVDQEKRVGSSFIEEIRRQRSRRHQRRVYAKPGVKPLKYDVFSLKGARHLPIIVVIRSVV
jgi:hypothetical protein